MRRHTQRAYAGTIPTVALGFLADAIGLTGALAVFSLIAICIVAFVLLVGRRLFTEVIPYRPPADVVATART